MWRAAALLASLTVACAAHASPNPEAARSLASCDVVLVPGHVVGCRGIWTRYPVCPDGWRACTALPPEAAPACASDLGGFFAANVALWSFGGGGFQCRIIEEADAIALAGCGIKPQRGSTVTPSTACSGFSLALPCIPTTALLCDASGTNPSANQSALNGVLCCR